MLNRTLSQVINNADNNARLQNLQLGENSIVIIPELNMITKEALNLIERSDVVDSDNIYIVQSAAWADISPESELGKTIKESGVRYPAYESHTALNKLPPDFSHVCGICMTGHSPFATITSHEPGTKQSVLQQVSEFFDVELSERQAFIAAYEIGGVKAMERFGEECFMSHDEIHDAIQDVLAYDRSEGRGGVTPEEERMAERAIAEMEIKDQNLAVVHLPHDAFQTVIDRLYDDYKNILIISDTGSSYLYSGDHNYHTVGGKLFSYDDIFANAVQGPVYNNDMSKMSQEDFNKAVLDEAKNMSLNMITHEIHLNRYDAIVYDLVDAVNCSTDLDNIQAASDNFNAIVDAIYQESLCSEDTLIDALDTYLKLADPVLSLPDTAKDLIHKYYQENVNPQQHARDDQMH